MFKNCRVIGCKKPARAATDDGLDTRFCRAHADHYARHGSPYTRSYTATEINPYRRAALAWLRATRTTIEFKRFTTCMRPVRTGRSTRRGISPQRIVAARAGERRVGPVAPSKSRPSRYCWRESSG